MLHRTPFHLWLQGGSCWRSAKLNTYFMESLHLHYLNGHFDDGLVACAVAGTSHQGKEFFPDGANASCVPTAACAIAYSTLGHDYDPAVVNTVVADGYQFWTRCRELNLLVDGFMYPDELPQLFTTCGKSFVTLDVKEWPGGLFFLLLGGKAMSMRRLGGSRIF